MRTLVSGKNELAKKALKLTMETLKKYGNSPNNGAQDALKDITDTLTSMAYESAEGLYYLSSIDPGMGKTTAIIQWIKAFLEEESLKHVGVIVCFERYDEIDRFINDGDIPKDCFSIYVTDGNQINNLGLGKCHSQSARVLITTKAQIKLKSKNKLFNDLKAFYYLGKPRQVRVWDESLLIGKGLTLKRTALGKLLETLEQKPELLNIVEKLMNDLKDYKDGTIFQMPDLDISLNELMEMFFEENNKNKETAETLGLMSNKAVTIRTDSSGPILVDCVEDMPEDFTPCLVTDASGRVRETYKLHEFERKNLKRLKPATKKYSNLTINIWRSGGGRNAYNEKLYIMAEEIANVIKQRPGEEFLVIYRKSKNPLRNDDLKYAVLNYLGDTERVKFLHYGLHTATNLYANIPNVVLAGMLFYRVADYEALGRAEANRPTAKGIFSSDEMSSVRLGELAHHLLQAVCRGKIRKFINNTCPNTNLWLIADPRTGIEALLPKIFPDCKISMWRTLNVNLSGRRKEALDFIKSQFENGFNSVPLTLVRKKVNIPDAYTFKRDIYNNDEFRQALADMEIALEGVGKGAKFIKMDFSYFFPDDDNDPDENMAS